MELRSLPSGGAPRTKALPTAHRRTARPLLARHLRFRSIWLALPLLAAIAPAGPASAQLKELLQGPVIRFDTKHIDLGSVEQFGSRHFTFDFENQGTDPLIIDRVETSCPCTRGAAEADTVLPGERSAIRADFDSESAEGPQLKVLAVFSNDPASPRVDLVIEANIVPYVEVENELLDFGRVRAGETPRLSTTFSAEKGLGFKILSIEGGESFVDWSVSPDSVADRDAYRIEARIKANAPLGAFNQRVMVHFQHPKVQDRRIGVRGVIYSYFIPLHTQIRFGVVRLGKTLTRQVQIDAVGDEGYKITGVKTTADFLTAKIEPAASGYQLSVTLATGDTPIGEDSRFPFREWVQIQTTDPRNDDIPILLTGMIRR
jgi:hypothetical protein